MYIRQWVLVPATDTVMNIFHNYLLFKLYSLFEKTENKQKMAHKNIFKFLNCVQRLERQNLKLNLVFLKQKNGRFFYSKFIRFRSIFNFFFSVRKRRRRIRRTSFEPSRRRIVSRTPENFTPRTGGRAGWACLRPGRPCPLCLLFSAAGGVSFVPDFFFNAMK